jgi:hypothetical protein
MNQDFIFSNRFYVDLSREICPRVGLLADAAVGVDDEAQVYLWRRCYLEYHLD